MLVCEAGSNSPDKYSILSPSKNLPLKTADMISTELEKMIMNDTFLSAILGAVIGGTFSIIATFIANKNSRHLQTLIIQKEIDRQSSEKNIKTKRYAGLLKIEILSWIELSIFRINEVKSASETRPDNLDFNENYRLYLDSIIEIATFEETKRIMKLYGMAKQISIHLFSHSYINVNNSTPKELTKSCEALIREVFSDEIFNHFMTTDPCSITRDYFVG